MHTEKSGSKPIVKVLIILLVIAALAVGVAFVLSGRDKDSGETQPTLESTQQTEAEATEEIPTEPEKTEPTETQSGSEDAATYTVVFKNYDGTVLKTETVAHGKAATAPEKPSRKNYNFAGWDKPFDNVTSDLEIIATFTTNRTIISAESVSVNRGSNVVTVKFRVINNPGIMGAVLKVEVDDKVFELDSGKNEQYPGLNLTVPGEDCTASPYTVMLDAQELSAEDKKDGTLFTLTFKIKDTSVKGNFPVKLSFDEGAIFDANYKDPKVVLENGTITIR